MLAFLAVDLLWTTLHRGGGPTIRAMTSPLWRIIVRTRYHSSVSHRVMNATGIALLVLNLGVWFLLLWFGWTLIFCAAPRSVVEAQTSYPADLAERVYFVGFTAFTLGMGDFKPEGTLWQISTAVCSLSGFLIVTFGVTYLMPVVEATVSKRAFASRISALGRSPAEIIRTCVNSEDASGLLQVIGGSTHELARAAHQHDTFPVLHFLHPIDAQSSLSVAVARLDEALRVVRLASRDDICSGGHCAQWDDLVQRLVDAMGLSDVREDIDAPPIPRLEELGDHLQTVDASEFNRRMQADHWARRRIHSLVRHHGWMWEAVDGGRTDRDTLRTESSSGTIEG